MSSSCKRKSNLFDCVLKNVAFPMVTIYHWIPIKASGTVKSAHPYAQECISIAIFKKFTPVPSD